MAKLTGNEMRANFEKGALHYRGYDIKAKADFQHSLCYDQGFYVCEGLNVVKDGCNAVPGATWFRTVDDAKEAIDVLEAVGEKKFWIAMFAIKEAKKNAVAKALVELAG